MYAQFLRVFLYLQKKQPKWRNISQMYQSSRSFECLTAGLIHYGAPLSCFVSNSYSWWISYSVFLSFLLHFADLLLYFPPKSHSPILHLSRVYTRLSPSQESNFHVALGASELIISVGNYLHELRKPCVTFEMSTFKTKALAKFATRWKWKLPQQELQNFGSFLTSLSVFSISPIVKADISIVFL